VDRTGLVWFMNWPDDGPMSRNMLPDL